MIYLSFFLAIASEGNQTSTYTDKFGNKWRVPLNNIGKTVLDSIINYIPRIDRKFSCISPDFDLEDKEYLDSSLMYIYISVGIGLIFFTYSILKLVLVNFFNVCGKNTIPRRGYPKYSIAKTRLTIIITAFFFEGVLFYGYFANRDLHNVINVLMKTFQSLKGEMDTNMTTFINSIPNKTSNEFFNENRELFIQDLNFSVRYAKNLLKKMSNIVNKYEGVRMTMILINLVLSTFSCSVGIASGNISKGFVVIIMIILNAIAGLFLSISWGVHFAGSKIAYEYCDELSSYIQKDDKENVPNRLRFFVPCVNSPIIELLKNHYVVNAIIDIKNFNHKYKKSLPVYFNNITSYYYKNYYGNDNQDFNNTLKSSSLLNLLLNFNECQKSFIVMKEENFLFCTYMKENLNMLMVSQGLGFIFILILTIIAFPAIKKFEFAGKANIHNFKIKPRINEC